MNYKVGWAVYRAKAYLKGQKNNNMAQFIFWQFTYKTFKLHSI